MTTILLLTLLAALCFLYTLNLFLRGAATEAIGGVIGLLIVATLISSFFLLGWRRGLLAIAAAFILVAVCQPLARRVAQRLLGYRTGIADLPEGTDILGQLEKGQSLESILTQVDRETEADRERLSKLARRPGIVEVLGGQRASFDEFEQAFQSLKSSALHDLAWEIVSTPRDLERLFAMRRQRKTEAEISGEFRKSV